MTSELVLLPLIGCGLGLGAYAMASALIPRRRSLAAELARLDLFVHPGTDRGGPSARRLERLGLAILRVLPSHATSPSQLDCDLAVVGKTKSVYAARVSTCFLVGLVGGPAVVLLASSIGVHLGLALPFAACMGVAATATFVPVASLRSEARSERRRFRRAFGCWLDLVALAQAAGMGVESALSTASDMGLGPAFSMIHRAVDVARSAGSTPWEGLARLGREIGMPELEELAASLALAGTEGARVRSSLVAKAESLRTRDLAESEAEANAVTERLFLPAVVMMLGFLLFICYPAVVTVAHGL